MELHNVNLKEPSDLARFGRYSDSFGQTQRISSCRRNGRPAIVLPPSCIELPLDVPETPPFWHQERLFVSLNRKERSTFERILRGRTINEIAAEDGVRRSAVYARIRGSSKKHGGMIAKNFWVLWWWLLRQALNPQKH